MGEAAIKTPETALPAVERSGLPREIWPCPALIVPIPGHFTTVWLFLKVVIIRLGCHFLQGFFKGFLEFIRIDSIARVFLINFGYLLHQGRRWRVWLFIFIVIRLGDSDAAQRSSQDYQYQHADDNEFLFT